MPTAALTGPTVLTRFARQLVIANLAIFLMLTLTAALALVSSRTAYSTRALQSAENLARVLSVNIGSEIKQVDNALVSTILGAQRQAGGGPIASDTLARLASQQHSLVPQVGPIRVTDSQGLVIDPQDERADAEPVSLGDRAYFAAARAAPTKLIISDPLQGRIDKKWGIVLARARIGSDGKFQGVACLNISTEHLVDLLDDLAVGQQGAVTLRSDSLRLVARYAAAASTASSDMGTAKVSRDLRLALETSPDHGGFISRTLMDGVERATAYQRVPDYPLLVLVGLGTDDAYTPWRREALALTLLCGLLELLIVGLSVLLFRQRQRQVQALRQVTQLSNEQAALLDNELVSMARFRDRVIVWHNKAMSRLFGYGSESLVGKPAREFYVHEEVHAEVGRGYSLLAAGQHYRAQVEMQRRDGRVIWVDLSGVQLNEEESLWMMVDITAVKESESQARHVAMHDVLTGLGNRAQLPQALDRALRGARSAGRGLAVCYVDLDGFKAVNDGHGHDAGDTLLREVAQRMIQGVRSEDALVRMGGDEFVIVLNGLGGGHREIEMVLQRLLASLQQSFVLGPAVEVTIGASIGVAIFPEHGDDADTLMSRADQAMYEAKRAGKNRLVFSSA